MVKNGISTGDTNKFIHCIWYCVWSGSSRFERDEANFIKELKRNCAIGAISGFVATAAAIGASPIPFSDCAMLVPNEVAMLSSITAIYGINVTKGFISTVLACTIGAYQHKKA